MHHAQLSESVHASNVAAIQMQDQLTALGQSPQQISATINRLLDQQAFTMAVTDMFSVSSWLFLALIGVVWLTQPRRAATVAAKVTNAAH